MKELSKIYDPKQVEDRTYQFWLDGGYFHAEPNPDKKPYTIVNSTTMTSPVSCTWVTHWMKPCGYSDPFQKNAGL